MQDITFDVADIMTQTPSVVSFDIKSSKQDYYRQGCHLKFAANGSSTCACEALAKMVIDV